MGRLGITAQQGVVIASQSAQSILSAPGSSAGQQVVMAAPQIAGSVGTMAVSGTAWAAAAIPIIGAAVAGVTMWLTSIFRRGAQKEAATRIVDEIEVKLKENLQGYLSLPVRYQSAQAQALANFDAAWQAVVENCSNPQLGSAGQRCIQERQRGGSAPWCPTGTGCDWFALYRDPIANDPNVRPDPVFDPQGRMIDPLTGQNAVTVDGILSGTVLGIDAKLVAAGALLLVVLAAGSAK